jgi:hypothetical protein
MAWHIIFFLKSLTSLEEFRKNPHVKFPPKSPCANFQSLGIFKNPIFNSEILFLDFGPASSLILFLAQPWPTSSLPVRPSRTELVRFQNLSDFITCPFSPLQTCPIRPENLSDPVASPTGRCTRARPTRPKPRWRICRKAYSLRLCALWQRRLLSLSRHCHVGPTCQLHPLPPPPADRCHSSPPATLRRPASNLEMPGEVITPRLDFPINFTP